MKMLLPLLVILSQLSFAAEKSEHEQLLAKHTGKWDTVVKGRLAINGNVVNKLDLSGRRQAESIFNGKVIRSVFTLKGTNFEGGKTDARGLGFLMWDEEKKSLRMIEFMSDGMAFNTLCKVIDSSNYKTLFKAQPGVINNSGIGFSDDGKTMKSFMKNETVQYGAVSEMTWLSQKSEQQDFKVELQPVTRGNEKFIGYKTDAFQWILKGKFLYGEGKDDKGMFISVIGDFPRQKAKKITIYEDGSVKAFRPINIHTWKEVELGD